MRASSEIWPGNSIWPLAYATSEGLMCPDRGHQGLRMRTTSGEKWCPSLLAPEEGVCGSIERYLDITGTSLFSENILGLKGKRWARLWGFWDSYKGWEYCMYDILFFYFLFMFFIILVLGVHCDIHQSSYNISYLNSPHHHSPSSSLPPFLNSFNRSHFSIFFVVVI
jgi:hypothetical protein